MNSLRVSVLILILITLTLLVDVTATRVTRPGRVVGTFRENSQEIGRTADILARGQPESPRLRGMAPLPANMRLRDVKPMPMPTLPERDHPPVYPPGSENRILTIDRKSGEVYEQSIAAAEDLLGSRYTDAGIGVYDLLENPEAVAKNFDPWVLVSDPHLGYFPRSVKIFVWFRDQSGILHDTSCTGTLIDPMHVLTAAHCLYEHTRDNGATHIFDYAEIVQIIPGYEDENEPFGYAQWDEMHVWSLWSEERDFDHDIGVIDLDRPVGGLTGWWGYGYNEDCDYFTSPTWRHAGYPAEPPYDGEYMYRNEGDFDLCPIPGYDYCIRFEVPSSGGLSGAGSLKVGTDAVFSVISTSDRETRTSVCQLTAAKYSQIGQMIFLDMPLVYDLVAMDANAPATIDAGERLDYFDFAVLNYAQNSAAGDWDYEVYLSSDATIAADDLLLGSGTFNYGFGVNGLTRVTLATPPVIPADTPPRGYFLGVLLNHSDWNDNNNGSHGQDASYIMVNCPLSAPPDLVGPYDGATCLSVDQYFSWNPVAALADYQLQLGTACDAGPIIETSRTWHTVFGLDLDTTYYWHVRSMTQCGEWGTWSPCWSFTTAPDLSVVVQPQSPADGEHCVDPVTLITWEPYPDVQGYEFRIGNNCGDGVVQSTVDNFVGVGLPPGMQYFWQARAQTDCGSWTDWSPCYTFKTAPDWAASPQMTSPENGSACASPDVFLVWENDPEAASYDVQIGTSCGEGTITNVDQNLLGQYGLLNDVTYWWRVRTNHECGPVSVWTPCWSFTVDAEPPSPPPVVVADRPVGVWSNDNTIFVDWDPATDDCSLPLYSHLFNEEPGTIPDDEPDSEATNTVSPALADGQDHWFHLKSVDSAGNASATVHVGPFWIDATAPSAPVIDYTTIDPDQPLGVGLLTVDWLPSTDATSGVSGYSWWLDIDPAPLDQPDLTVDIANLTQSLELEYEANLWYFLRSIDAAGNGSETTVLGPFVVDNELLGVGFIAPTRTDVLTEGDLFPVQWWLFDDGSAILQSGRLEYSLDAGATYHLIGNMDAALMNAGSWGWTVPVAGSEEAILRLTAFDTLGRAVRARSERFRMVQVSAIPDIPTAVDGQPVLAANHPNPFNPQTTIAFSLPVAAPVRLSIYDLAGHLVRILVDGETREAGWHHVNWDGCNRNGQSVATGVYVTRLESCGTSLTRRMTLVK